MRKVAPVEQDRIVCREKTLVVLQQAQTVTSDLRIGGVRVDDIDLAARNGLVGHALVTRGDRDSDGGATATDERVATCVDERSHQSIELGARRTRRRSEVVALGLLPHHPEHVRKILKNRLGWTSQKPRRKARERKDKEIERWKGDEFPRIVREAFKRNAHVVFLDEAGFMLNPSVRRTLAPRGKTPVLKTWDRHDRWSAISCVTLSPVAGRPGLYFDLLDHNVRGPGVVEFLKELHRRLGPLTVVWDRNQIHSKAKVVKAWLADHPGVVAEDFPGYVPDLNPDEGVWGWTKYGRLANLAANALRVAADGGTVRLSAGRKPSWIWMGVEDDGPGIAPEDQERVFQRFWRADGEQYERGRSGLGLTIVRQIAEAHGGEVKLVSEPGKGSAFAIWLPA